jgi:molybdenum cofactor cytidylyltransferase
VVCDAEFSQVKRSPSQSGNVVGIVLAAGRASRFGSTKQVAEIRGRPMLEYPLAALESAGIVKRLVVLGAEADRVIRDVPLHGARVVLCEDWEKGQSHSLASGVRAAGQADAVLVLLGDQPGVTAEAIRRVLDSHNQAANVVRASYNDVLGHPVLIDQSLFSEVASVHGDVGARFLFDRPGVEVSSVACEDVGLGADIDTTDDLAQMATALATGRTPS